jgi:hypothetical protein
VKERELKRIRDYQLRQEEFDRQEREALNESQGDTKEAEEPYIMWPSAMEKQS